MLTITIFLNASNYMFRHGSNYDLVKYMHLFPEQLYFRNASNYAYLNCKQIYALEMSAIIFPEMLAITFSKISAVIFVSKC